MNVEKGLYRLAQIVKWGGRVAGGLSFISNAVNFSPNEPMNSGTLEVLFLAICLVATTEGIAWILEGFADE